MKKLIALLTGILLLFSACEKNDNDTADRAEKEWTKFIQKHLIGEWKPNGIEVKPLLGAVVLQKDYADLQPPGTQDILILKQDYTGQFNTFLQQGQLKSIHFKWYHKLEELGVILDDKREFKTILLRKSSEELRVSIPLQAVIADLVAFIPELEEIDATERGLLFVHFNFVK
ncbi:hypothetical protein [Myroides sp. DW712]|uniref:hypothetical protein n=1 Tax=Myroides sp. DW712 TaxID=3389800 RepID=UPI00397C6CA3